MIISGMFCGSAFQVVSSADFENIAAFCIYIVTHIKPFFSLWGLLKIQYFTTFLLFFRGKGRISPPFSHFLGFRFCTSVNSNFSPPISKAICRSLFVISRFST